MPLLVCLVTKKINSDYRCIWFKAGQTATPDEYYTERPWVLRTLQWWLVFISEQNSLIKLMRKVTELTRVYGKTREGGKLFIVVLNFIPE